jgi:hypothetical protein
MSADVKEAISNNLLLYGPPGTGKTYNVVNYAVAIIEGRPLKDVIAGGYDLALRKYDRYTKIRRIDFMTFHQSLSYDDFIEGIRPEVRDDGSLIYSPVPGVFYSFCHDSKKPVHVRGRRAQGPAVRRFGRRCMGGVPRRVWCQSGQGEGTLGRQPSGRMPSGRDKAGDIVISMFSRGSSDAVGIVKDVAGTAASVEWAIVREQGPLCGIESDAPARLSCTASDFLASMEKEYPVFEGHGELRLHHRRDKQRQHLEDLRRADHPARILEEAGHARVPRGLPPPAEGQVLSSAEGVRARNHEHRGQVPDRARHRSQEEVPVRRDDAGPGRAKGA